MVKNDLDAFFDAAGSGNPLDVKQAADTLLKNDHVKSEEDRLIPPDHFDILTGGTEDREGAPAPASVPAPEEGTGKDAGAQGLPKHLEGKFIAVAPGEGDEDAPFVLIPAHIYSYVPWWGWAAIGVGLVMLAAGVVFMPVWSLNRLASRLGDGDEANAQHAMRQLIMNGDGRTVRKLFDMASSGDEGLTARLRAVDTMSLIDDNPEVDRALLRLELAGGTDAQVREAAIAARKQREASRIRGFR